MMLHGAERREREGEREREEMRRQKRRALDRSGEGKDDKKPPQVSTFPW